MKDQSRYCVQQIKLVVVREEQAAEDFDINSPAMVYELPFLREELISTDREKFICLHLNAKNRVTSWELVSIGTLNSSLVHPREVFKGAILANAASIILCHNHPSGDAEPSEDDIVLTKRLAKVGELLGISVLDHLVFTDTNYLSLKERGVL